MSNLDETIKRLEAFRDEIAENRDYLKAFTKERKGLGVPTMTNPDDDALAAAREIHYQFRKAFEK